jgi:alpha-glucosidase (family GH31 glycosyl hydrolase)
MRFIWILITWKALDALLGTRNISGSETMVAELAEDGFKTVVIIDPGIKLTKNIQYIRGFKRLFLQRADGPYMKGKVWPGGATSPTIPIQVREWWADCLRN